jgi:hypothetical protein
VRNPLPIEVWEDYQAWEKYGQSDLRWVFNKLEVALRQGLHAGPAGVPPSHGGLFITRPIYNLYGMGIGAEQFSYETRMYDDMVQHKFVKPGFFWCEWIVGQHLSIDYQKYDNGTWEAVSVWEGVHYSDSNLTKFKSWTKLSTRAAPSPYDLPLNLEWLFLPGVSFFNVELRAGHIIDLHLRPGDYKFRDLPVGTSLFPVWEDMPIEPRGEWLEDADPDMSKYAADGHLKEIRDGFIVVRDSHQ